MPTTRLSKTGKVLRPRTGKYKPHSVAATVEAYRMAGTQVGAANLLGVSQSAVSEFLRLAKQQDPELDLTPYSRGKTEIDIKTFALPAKGKIARYFLTCAQNDTDLDKPTWKNLSALALEYDAPVLCSTIAYNKNAFGQAANSKHGRNLSKKSFIEGFDPVLRKHICDERLRWGEGDKRAHIEFLGQLNIIPTSRRPLSGMEDFSGRLSSIVPHPVIQVKSVAALKTEATKLMYTTGAVTKPNYIQRKEGFRAEHYHSLGALLIEINDQGHWWCRHVEQGVDGCMWDLDICVKNGTVTRGNRVEAITWGDIHATQMDVEAWAAGWAPTVGLLDFLRPKEQHCHDVLDFGPRSHHRRKDPMEMFRLHVQNTENVRQELERTATTLSNITRPWTKTVVVHSNHHDHLERWLKDTYLRPVGDEQNMEVHSELWSTLLAGTRRDAERRDRDGTIPKHEQFLLPEVALQRFGCPTSIRFLREDESHVICRRYDGGIECGMHFHRGANGSRGSATGLARMGRRANGGDKHSAERLDGIAIGGVCTPRDLGWNPGPDSWTTTHIITYPNSTRTLATQWKGKLFAEQFSAARTAVR
jgi:hypothetical protein